ncbi:Bug family tripartite tricarboxylate transporter substrate binding protein [Falsiroseomonas sp. HC035]|uniref:Bug family tripartite tricarboxylate transporter substrate binding protein n=1 Tax=Falsiroseomonas sp. HC035 TaxID=3390999 RepID=UPI003D322810
MRRLIALFLLIPGLALGQTGGQNGPPIRLIVPFAPGGASDVTARIVAPPLAVTLGRTIVIENRPGAGGMLGAEAMARGVADGTVLGISNTSPHGTVPLVAASPPYDSDRDFTHIAMVAETPTVLLVPMASPFATLPDFLAAARARSGGLSFASTGVGSLQHLQGEALAQAAGGRLVHVPYRGTGPALQDLIGGTVDSLLTPLAGTTGAISGGQARVLAVSSAQGFAPLPGVPTYAALGFPGLTATSWTGISGPRGLPPAFVAQVNAAVNRIVALPETAVRLEAAGLYPPAVALDAASFQAVVADFARVWRPVVAAANIPRN